MRDRLVVGIRDDDTRHRLLSTPALTLEDAVRICRAEEAAKATQQDMPQAQVGRAPALRKTRYQRSKQSQSSSNASSTRSHEPQPSGKPPVRKQEGDNQPRAKCPKCEYDSHPLSRCPAREKTCNSCGEKGHFQRRCPADAPQLGHLRLQVAKFSGNNDRIEIPTCLNNHDPRSAAKLRWLPKTGSNVDAINPDGLRKLGGKECDLVPDPSVVLNANGGRLTNIGMVTTLLSVGDRQIATQIHVYDGLQCPLLSRQSLKKLGIPPADLPRSLHA